MGKPDRQIRCLIGLGLIAWLSSAVVPSGAAEFHIVEPGGRDTHSVIALDGAIVRGDADRLSKAIDQLPSFEGGPWVILTLDSSGGDYAEALKVGRMIRDNGIATKVVNGQRCLAACAFLFLGGGSSGFATTWIEEHSIAAGGLVAFVGLRHDEAVRDLSGGGRAADTLMGAILDYLHLFPIDHAFAREFMALQPLEVLTLDRVDRLRALSVTKIGVPRPTDANPQNILNLCNWATNWGRPLSFSGDPVAEVTALTREAFMRKLLLGTVTGEGPLEKKGPLADHIRTVAQNGNEAAIEALYREVEDLGILRLTLPEQGDRFYSVTGFSFGGGFYAASCYVELNLGTRPEAVSFANVVTGDTNGNISAAFHSFNLSGDVLYELYEREAALP